MECNYHSYDILLRALTDQHTFGGREGGSEEWTTQKTLGEKPLGPVCQQECGRREIPESVCLSPHLWLCAIALESSDTSYMNSFMEMFMQEKLP